MLSAALSLSLGASALTMMSSPQCELGVRMLPALAATSSRNSGKKNRKRVTGYSACSADRVIGRSRSST